ncbi:MAG: methyltransferase domain-containing protein [Chloroflexota bacterium]|nr:methyltransferase domain-containing protein [Chloroflexota bacterium]
MAQKDGYDLQTDAHVNYDRLASSYDRRFAASRQEGIVAALLALAQDLDTERILEVGCGTGRWLADLWPVTHRLYGLDPSTGMLQQARKRKKQFYLIRGRAGQLPFPDTAFDLIYCVNAIHHFDRPRAFVSEARRLLRPGGVLAVIGTDPHSRRDDWYIYHYFEGTLETDLSRFPSWGTILDWMVAAGFEGVEWRLVERIQDNKVGREVLDDPFLQRGTASQIALLTDEACAAGLRRIETALAEAEATGETLVFPVDLSFGILIGRVQGSDQGHCL